MKNILNQAQSDTITVTHLDGREEQMLRSDLDDFAIVAEIDGTRVADQPVGIDGTLYIRRRLHGALQYAKYRPLVDKETVLRHIKEKTAAMGALGTCDFGDAETAQKFGDWLVNTLGFAYGGKYAGYWRSVTDGRLHIEIEGGTYRVQHFTCETP